jgi:hypothetical protein
MRARERSRLDHVDPGRRDIMKNTHRILTALALAAWLVPDGALAQHETAADSDADRWVPVRRLEFSADEIEGGVIGPDGEQIVSVPRTRHRSLIELRAGFETEIVKTLEDL